MRIPEKFKTILEKNQILYSIVLDIVTSLNPIYADNKLFFFEEYTDHGIKHIESVLTSAEMIIEPDTLSRLSDKEVSILIIAIILHDLGMHIELKTFNAMLNGDYAPYYSEVMNDYPWDKLWADYLAEVKRFSSKQRMLIYGNSLQPFKVPNLEDKDSIDGYDKKTIGEFIRRHHPRIAHEIALGGIYASNGIVIKLGNEKLPNLYRQLSGIIARSHGVDLRDTFAYLESIAGKGWRNPEDINVIFLMITLRLADYIQIDSSRVDSILLKLKTFGSPISIQEHRNHLSVSSISLNQLDSEMIYVRCLPLESETFNRLNNLVNSIQNEFDKSWAVIGEVYGFLLSSAPKIKFRRITSNLNERAYLANLDYIHSDVNFQVSNELSKLLVGPLYGNRATFGVRELLQNAVDACMEKKQSTPSLDPLITVRLNIQKGVVNKFVIEDNGKGMNAEEIINYFLTVGASFRKSLIWQKEFTDSDGHALINRNGKFGIGVLAAFLLGEEIDVTTNSESDKYTYNFKARIDSEHINILRTIKQSSVPSGTTISIPISEAKGNELLNDKDRKWCNWYIGDFPQIKFYHNDNLIKVESPLKDRILREFDGGNYYYVQWSYINAPSRWNPNNYSHSFFACNNIIISNSLADKKNEFSKHLNKNVRDSIISIKPSIFIEDPNGTFPIKLDRNDIDCYELPFEDLLYEEVCKELISKLLTLKIDNATEIKALELEYHNVKIIYSKTGYTFNIDFFSEKLIAKNIGLLRVISNASSFKLLELASNDICIYPEFNERINLRYQERNVAPEDGARILLRRKTYELIFDPHKTRIPKYIKNNALIIDRDNDFVIYDIYSAPENIKLLKEINSPAWCKREDIESVQEVKFSNFVNVSHPILKRLLEEYFSDNVLVPYDLKKRKKVFAKAFADLHNFM